MSISRQMKVLFTALPNGYDPSRSTLKLSVFITPRLTPKGGGWGTLDEFGDWLHWASTPIGFKVAFRASGTTVSHSADIVGPDRRPDLWDALFTGSSPVRAYGYEPLDTRRIRSYRVRDVVNYIKQLYQESAVANPDQYPPVAKLEPTLDPIAISDRMAQELLKHLNQEQVVTEKQPFDPRADFLRLKAFHLPAGSEPGQAAEVKRVSLKDPEVDFHDLISHLGQYPSLLRGLGLVFDLEVKRSPDIPALGDVQVVPSWQPDPDLAPPDVTPWTVYDFAWDANPQFRPHQRPGTPPELDAGGYLPLGDPKRYEVIQVDPDAAGLKAMHFALNLGAFRESPFHQPEAAADKEQFGTRAALPALRSTGLSVIRRYRAQRLLQQFQSARQNQLDLDGGSEIRLYADDLMRGWRLDVWQPQGTAGKWRSLHEREGTYEFTKSGRTEVLKDEGWASGGATQSADPDAPDDLYVHEALLEWNGWSLSAPRPEKTVLPDETVGESGGGGTKFGFSAAFRAVKGSLPRLRFGRTYHLRARSVDLAGNGPALTQEAPDKPPSSPPVTYARFDPVSSPVLIYGNKPKEAESLEHLVVRSWSKVGSVQPPTEETGRHVAPPLTAQEMAEKHGAFDDATQAGGWNKHAYKQITDKEGVPPERSDEKRWELNYLPEPVARGATFVGLPGTKKPVAVSFEEKPGESWPDYKPFRMQVVGGSAAPHDDPAEHLLTVYLPPAEVAKVRLSSHLSERDLEQMGIWQWIKEKVSESDPLFEQLKKQISEGRHWMVTPFSDLTLVHAVQQPLKEPRILAINPSRDPGATRSTLALTIRAHGKSTGKLDLLARWEEPVDPLNELKPKVLTDGRAQVSEIKLAATDTLKATLQLHDFGDTKHRKVSYHVSGLTRFPEYYPAGTSPLTRESREFDVHIPSSARPDAPAVLYVIPTFRWEESPTADGVVRTRKGGLRVYLDRPWYSTGADEALGVLVGVGPVSGAVWLPSFAAEMRERFQSQVAEDPIQRARPTFASLLPHHFPMRLESRTEMLLAEEAGVMATVVSHPVAYDEDRHLWYCDLEVKAGSGTYFPFVRLVLARFQPYSVDGHHLSATVQADYIQLTPDRSLSLVRLTEGIRVYLKGPGPVVLPQVFGGSTALSRKAEAVIEQQGSLGELDWRQVGDVTTLSLSADGSLFAGAIALPSPLPTAPLRLVVREYERLAADSGNRIDPVPSTVTWRVTYVDTVKL